VSVEQEAYAASCYALHEELGLGDRFRFMGGTTTPRQVMRDAGVVILTSISEGFPMAVLEALSEARPVVATAVGGVAEALEGCGLVAGPGRVHDLADAVLTLLRHPDLARQLGQRGHGRTSRKYRIDTTLDSYEALFDDLREQRKVMA
jgi:glycosyltransferase involved in cell wall biosynthesis